jgi:hypothetical protein
VRTIFLAAAAIALFTDMAVNLAAAETRVRRCEVVEYGLYDLKTDRQINAPGVAAGSVAVTKGTLIRTTTEIPARLGTGFGYKIKLIGSPVGATVKVKDINIVPEPGLRNPSTGNVIYREESDYTRKIGDTWRSDYQLNHEWTLLPGKWIFQIWVDDRKMCEQVFNLQKQ